MHQSGCCHKVDEVYPLRLQQVKSSQRFLSREAHISFFEDQCTIPLRNLDFNTYHNDFPCPR